LKKTRTENLPKPRREKLGKRGRTGGLRRGKKKKRWTG